MDQRMLIAAVAAVAIVVVGMMIMGGNSGTPERITSFEECEAAGYPIQESYPPRCCVPNGACFTGPGSVEPITKTCLGMTREEAETIAAGSECSQGALRSTGVCNEGTRTWWIDMELEAPGCSPACVINVDSKAAEINWRCTGLIIPEPTPDDAEQLDDSQATQAGVASVISANNEFAIDFYKKTIETETGNVFFSPWSLESALSMTYEGAKGQTATEMASVLKIPSDLNERGPAFATLFNDINAPGKQYQLSTANALWVEQTYTLLDSFTDTVSNYYSGGANNVDFISDAEGSRQTINTWVAEKTMDKIKDLIPQGIIDSMTRLVLTNAVYFKGTWKTQFDPDDTRDAEFRKPGQAVTTKMMSLTEEEFKYAGNDDVQLLEIPYSGDELSMVILLPTSDSLAGLEESLGMDSINALRATADEVEIPVYLPKFKFETKYMLKDVLSAMGMPTAFAMAAADFSGISGARDLYIGQVIHQAYVDVNEEGTEAAAATAVIMPMGAAFPPLEFRADHPFIFMIMKGDQILFMGRVMDPTVAN